MCIETVPVLWPCTLIPILTVWVKERMLTTDVEWISSQSDKERVITVSSPKSWLHKYQVRVCSRLHKTTHFCPCSTQTLWVLLIYICINIAADLCVNRNVNCLIGAVYVFTDASLPTDQEQIVRVCKVLFM